MSNVRLSGHNVSEDAISAVMMFIVVYVIAMFLSVLGVMLCGTDPATAFSGVVASIGSVGPGLGELGCLDNFSAQPSMAKFIYTFHTSQEHVECIDEFGH